ncbi:dfc82867-5923-46ac-80e3-6a1684512162-CDS [Sclerotinia trifoliorum]|uniref:Dfc82867-5923-46ac-80e3-6a1684512162-CDS n=1 Tax=Sclerotinia trifoliorum TaxID=28548 RepID=A0A8H2VQN3_9HELO|nr:dfc82867-5923-46ac-80e3-6a1684512162-CDS [Sclerotinia trifoliorum]
MGRFFRYNIGCVSAACYISLLSPYMDLFRSNSQMIHVLALFYEDILEFHRAALRVSANQICYPSIFRRIMVTYISAWKQIFRATWKDFDSKFSHIIDGLDRHKSLLFRTRSFLSKSTRRSILAGKKKQFEAIEKEDNKRQRLALLDWLAATDPILNHETAVAMRADYPPRVIGF